MLIHPFRGLRFFIPTADAQGTGRAGVLPAAALGLDCKENTNSGKGVTSWLCKERHLKTKRAYYMYMHMHTGVLCVCK